jgi:hypothetical protein
MTRRLQIALGLAVMIAAWQQSPAVRAFSDSEAFAWPAIEGGGDGRYFTGSPNDPYSCSVCHRGGRAPELTLLGFPARLVPGKTHDVTIRWTSPKTSHALALELATADGSHADLRLQDPGSLPPQQRCERREDGAPAVFATDVGRRRILGVQDCGASELGFSFTVPESAKLFLSLGLVRSDGSGTPEGDGVLELREELGSAAGVEANGCDALPGRAANRWAGGLWLVVPAILLRRRAARGRDLGGSSMRSAGTVRLGSMVPLALVLVLLAACFSPTYSSDDPAGPDAATPYFTEDFAEILGEARPGGSDAVSCPRVNTSERKLRFSVRTVSAQGRYRPRNVGAIWVADESDRWLKTLEMWGTRRAKWLGVWNAASGGDVVDAITGPTLAMHRVHQVEWNFTDADGCEVGEGSYELQMELTDSSGAGPTISVPFELDGQPQELRPESEPPFLDLHLIVE